MIKMLYAVFLFSAVFAALGVFRRWRQAAVPLAPIHDDSDPYRDPSPLPAELLPIVRQYPDNGAWQYFLIDTATDTVYYESHPDLKPDRRYGPNPLGMPMRLLLRPAALATLKLAPYVKPARTRRTVSAPQQSERGTYDNRTEADRNPAQPAG